MQTNYIVGIIGAGNMGEALIRGLLRSQLVRPYELLASRRDSKKRKLLEKTYGVHCTPSNIEIVESCPTVILAVKPQNMREIMSEIKDSLTDTQLIISIAAGIDVDTIRKSLGKKINIIRTMPNLPAVIDQGVTAIYCNGKVPERYRRFAHQIFQAVGTTFDIHKEELMDVVTAVSGTGPAYFFAIMEAMRDKAISMGLTASMADQLVRDTASGAAQLVINSHSTPEQLRKQVTSFKGTTWAAMNIFTKQKFWKTVGDAIAAAAKRAKELRKGK